MIVTARGPNDAETLGDAWRFLARLVAQSNGEGDSPPAADRSSSFQDAVPGATAVARAQDVRVSSPKTFRLAMI